MLDSIYHMRLKVLLNKVFVACKVQDFIMYM